MKSKLFLVVSIFIASFMLSGCYGSLKNDKVYFINDKNSNQNTIGITNPINTEGMNPFHKFTVNFNLQKNQHNIIPITISPDEKTIFIMEDVEDKSEMQVIKGEPKEKVNLIKYNVASGKQEVIAENIYFITTAKWNKEGNIIGFCGGGELKIYDVSKNIFILQDELKNKEVINFGWSPDGKKAYIEQPALVNDSIAYLDSGKLVNAYETNEELYYKGQLDSTHYYCTLNKQTINGLTTTTVIVNDMGEVVKDFLPGKFADSFKRAMLEFGERKEGLYYYSDINKTTNVKVVTKEPVQDAKFIVGGNIAYTVKNNDIEKNNYFLHIINSEGDEIKKYEVSGPAIAVVPDGKLAYIAGPNEEKLDLLSFSLDSNSTSSEHLDSEKEEIFKTIRGAMRTYYKFIMNEENDLTNAKKYFIDSHNPEQWANFDLQTMYNKNVPENIGKSEYISQIYLKSINRYVEGGYERASIVIQEYNDIFYKIYNTYPLEMIRIDNRWYVTGISTFPNNNETKEIKKIVEYYVGEGQSGRAFGGALAGKEVKIGQIQFWDMNDTKLAYDIKKADGCKVFLRVIENNEEITYKLTLGKGYDGNWKALNLRKDRLNYLN